MINTELEVKTTICDIVECVCIEYSQCSEKDTKREFSNIDKKLQCLPGHGSDSLFCSNKTLEDIRIKQNDFLKNFNIDHIKVCQFLKGIYEKKETMKFHNVKEISKYSIFCHQSHGVLYNCPFCEENCNYIERLVHYNNFKILTNNINGKTIEISFIEFHMIIYHNFIPERVFNIIFEIFDIDDIVTSVEPEYEFINKWTFKGNGFFDFSVKDSLFNEYLSKVTFKKILFENGCMGYIVPTDYNTLTFDNHYEHLLRIIKTQNNLSDYIDMEHLYKNNRNIRIQIDYLFSQQNWTTLSKFTFDLKIVKEFEMTKEKYNISINTEIFDISKFYEQLSNDFKILNEKKYMNNLYSNNLIVIVILPDKQSKWYNDLRIKYQEMRSKYTDFNEFLKETEKFEVFKSTSDNIEFCMCGTILSIGSSLKYANTEYKLIKL